MINLTFLIIFNQSKKLKYEKVNGGTMLLIDWLGKKFEHH
jgi:hypothetical protein